MPEILPNPLILTFRLFRSILNNELFADVAQLVEQLIRNQQVAGSNPFIGSSKKEF